MAEGLRRFARDCSRADSRLNGGHVVANWGQFDPEWERIVFALQPGELSPVIPTPGGYGFGLSSELGEMAKEVKNCGE